jgi:hypothetical protein
MAVRFVDQLYSSGIKTQVDDRGWTTATAQIRFNAFVETPDDNEVTVKADARIPYEKSRHPLFASLSCSGISVDRRGPLHFEVSADYTSPPYKDNPGQGPGEQQGPLSQPTQVSYFTITSEEPIDEDINGSPITTACGEPISGIARPISDLGVRLAKNFATFDPATFYQFIDCVNSDTFIGFPPGTLRIANISSDEQFYTDENGNSVPYWSVNVEIHARKPYRTTNEKAWWKRVRHEGYQVRTSTFTPVGSLFAVVRAVDANKEPVSQPVQLDANGFKLADQSQATWREFKVFSEVSFASMGF